MFLLCRHTQMRVQIDRLCRGNKNLPSKVLHKIHRENNAYFMKDFWRITLHVLVIQCYHRTLASIQNMAKVGNFILCQ